MTTNRKKIELYGVKTHNIKDIDASFTQNALTVVTGVSGSGKSSLAFDSLFAEGQRRFLESVSTYARQFLDQMPKAPVTRVENILPAIALRQQSSMSHVRSTVASTSEILDFLMLLYANAGTQFCTACGGLVQEDTVHSMHEALKAHGEKLRVIVIADIETQQEDNAQVFARLVERGYMRLWIDGEIVHLEGADIDALFALKNIPVLIDRIAWKTGDQPPSRLIEASEEAFLLGNEQLRLEVLQSEGEAISLAFDRRFTCRNCGQYHHPLRPEIFDPNSTLGACPECTGFGRVSGVDWDKVIPHPHFSLAKNAIDPFKTPAKRLRKKRMIDFCVQHGIDTTKPWNTLTEEEQTLVMFGKGTYPGVMGFFNDLQAKSHKFLNRIALAHYRGYSTCERCNGTGFSKQARNVKLEDKAIHEILHMTVQEAYDHFERVKESEATAIEGCDYFIYETHTRLKTLFDVGLYYLTLNRQSKSLSGGEMQRLHLSTGLGRGLTDTLYVLDEPTAGLHPRDSQRLIRVMKSLRDMGNTLVVVEHDDDVIAAADHVMELGPGAGEFGGQIQFEGSFTKLLESDTATGRMFRSKPERRLHSLPPITEEWLTVYGAHQHNLKHLNVRIPLHSLVCITGVSGSGKSTLVRDIIANSWKITQKALDEDEIVGEYDSIEGFDLLADLIVMEQANTGRTARANAATMTKAYDEIRALMSKTKASLAAGIMPSHFSFNSKDGRCPQCEGRGTVTIEMQFLSDIELVCDACDGRRFKDKVLDIKYRGKNIDDILQLTVSEAMEFFEESNIIRRRMQPLVDVGLSYLRIGQPTSTLSGGEFQRLRLSTYLGKVRRNTQKTRLFILDEPTLGLHMQDVHQLITALRRMVDAGDSVLVVEHQTDLIAAADYIIDLGPEGGPDGGSIVYEGPAAGLIDVNASYTAQALREALRKKS